MKIFTVCILLVFCGSAFILSFISLEFSQSKYVICSFQVQFLNPNVILFDQITFSVMKVSHLSRKGVWAPSGKAKSVFLSFFLVFFSALSGRQEARHFYSLQSWHVSVWDNWQQKETRHLSLIRLPRFNSQTSCRYRLFPEGDGP